MAALENEQRFAYRTTTDVKGLGNFLLLDTFALLELTVNDPLCQVMGNLLGEAVQGLERHDSP